MSEIYLRNISNYAVLEAICAGFTVNHLPDICDKTKMIDISPSGDVR